VPETSIFENIDCDERKRVSGWLGANYTRWCWLVMLLMCSGRVKFEPARAPAGVGACQKRLYKVNIDFDERKRVLGWLGAE
jgi:hypothetical protein